MEIGVLLFTFIRQRRRAFKLFVIIFLPHPQPLSQGRGGKDNYGFRGGKSGQYRATHRLTAGFSAMGKRECHRK